MNDPIETLPAVRLVGFTTPEADSVVVERFAKDGNFSGGNGGIKVSTELYDRADSSRWIYNYHGNLGTYDYRFTVVNTGQVYSVSNLRFESGSFGKCGFSKGADYRYLTSYTINGVNVSGRTIDLIK